MSASHSDWIGSGEEKEELIALAPVLAAAAMLDDTTTEFGAGSPLPPLWQWFFFLPRAPQSQLGPDGHPRRGGFMPPIELPQRLFAGAHMRFLKPLRIGKPARRQSVIRDVSEKEGRTGKLAFVTVAHSISQDGECCIEEEQIIAYRQPGAPVGAPPTPRKGRLGGYPGWFVDAGNHPRPDAAVSLFCFTFNAHRIHYDRTYATTVEGYPGLVVQGPLVAVLLMEMVRFRAHRSVTAFTFRAQAPLFDLAPFRLIGTPATNQVVLEAQGPDGMTTLTAHAELD